MMKVVFVTAHDIWGSLDGFSPMQKIMTHLAEKGHRVVLLTHDKVNDPSTERYGAPVPSFHPNIEIQRFRLPGDGFLLKPLMRIPVIRSIYMRLRYEVLLPLLLWWHFFRNSHMKDTDIVYSYEIFGALVSYVIAKQIRKPLVVRFQGTFMYGPLWRAQQSILGKLELVRWLPHVAALRIPADLKIMTNDGTRGDWVLDRVHNSSPYVFWFNGTSFDLAGELSTQGQEFARQHLAIPLGQPVLVSVSRLVGWKRVDRIIRALPAVVSKVPNLQYYVVGTGEEQGTLSELARELKVDGHITFVGAQPHKEVFYYIKAANVFASAYDVSNIGNPLIEAMTLGTAIVTLNVGDTGTLIEDGKNGYLVEPDDGALLGERIADLLMDEEKQRQFGKAARKVAEDKFWTWDERLDTEERLLTDLVCKNESVNDHPPAGGFRLSISILLFAASLVGAGTVGTRAFAALATLSLAFIFGSSFWSKSLFGLYAVAPFAIMYYVPMFSFRGLTITILDATVLAVILTMVRIIFHVGWPPRSSARRIVAVALLFTSVSLIPAISMGDFLAGFPAILQLLKKWALYSVFLLGADYLSSKSLKSILKWTALAALVYFSSSLLFPRMYGVGRNVSLMFNPNVFGLFSVLTFNFAAGMLHTRTGGKLPSLLGITLATLTILATLSSGSRTAAVVLVAALLGWLILTRFSLKLIAAVMIALLVEIGPNVYSFLAPQPTMPANSGVSSTNVASGPSAPPPHSSDKTAGTGTPSTRPIQKPAAKQDRIDQRWIEVARNGVKTPGIAYRIDAVEVALHMWLDQPLFGYGPHGVPTFSRPYVLKYGTYVKGVIGTTDNQYVDILLELGLVGLALFSLVLILIWRAVSVKPQEPSLHGQLMWTARADILVLLVAGLAMPSFYTPFGSALVWFVFSLAYTATGQGAEA